MVTVNLANFSLCQYNQVYDTGFGLYTHTLECGLMDDREYVICCWWTENVLAKMYIV